MLRLVLFFVCLIYIVSAVEKICPGFGYVRQETDCVDNCDPKDDQCPTGTKCCHRPINPCGFQCVKPKLKYVKEGECPKSLKPEEDPDWSICDAHFCDVDHDCPDERKCCTSSCGAKVCLNPIF